MEIDKATSNEEEEEESKTTNIGIQQDALSSLDVVKEYDANKRTLNIVLLAFFSALGPVLSISFIWFPYFELMTLTIFVGAMILGPLLGIILAIFSTTILELIASILIGPGLPIYPFKILAFSIIALMGGFLGKIISEKKTLTWRFFIASLGGLGTLLYDLLTNIGMIFFMETSFVSYFSLLLIGLPITAAKVATNTVLFAFIPEIYNQAILPNVISRQKKNQNANSVEE